MSRPETRSSSSFPKKHIRSTLIRRAIFFAVAGVFFAGLGARLYFHPGRVRSLLEQAVGSEGARIGLKFRFAKLSIWEGAIPQIAVEVGGIELNPAHECRLEPSVRITKIYLPLNLTQLLRFRLAFGTVASEDIEIDLDALKLRCPSKPLAAGERGQNPSLLAGENAPSTASVRASPTPTPTPTLVPWWTEEQANAVKERVAGFDFSRVSVLFEEATKKVYLESLSLEAGQKPGSAWLETRLVIPPELTYGERLPILRIEALVMPTSAEIQARAALSEGNLIVKGHLLAAAGGYLDADLHAGVGDVPLSTLVPLVVKSGIVKGAFQPRFMWMNCQASIRGRFQGLFMENPLKLSDCEIVGKGGKIRIGEAMRKPSGEWQPFAVALSNLDLAQMMETFEWHGLDGVFSDYGQLDGEIKIKGNDSFEFNGDIKGARLHFLSHNEHTDQMIKNMRLRFEIFDKRANGLVSQIDLEDGVFDGELAFDSFDHGREGTIRADVKSLRLSEDVQKVLLAGHIDKLSGKFYGRFADRKMVQGSGNFDVRGLVGNDMRFPEAALKVESVEQGAAIRVQARAPSLEIRKLSRFFRGLSAVFFKHQFMDEWVKLEEPKLNIRILTSTNANFESASASWLRWEGAQATLENRRIRISSSGGMSRNHQIVGWLNADYPNVRRLKWLLSGQVDAPEVMADARHLRELQSKGLPDDTGLGLATKKSVLK